MIQDAMQMTSISDKKPSCSVIIVTHNSQADLPVCLEALKKQTCMVDQIIVVDSGSKDTSYLKEWLHDPAVHLSLEQDNIGFCQGNNLGLSQVSLHTDYVLFLNPDAFLTPTFIQEAISVMEKEEASNIGALSGWLLGYDRIQKRPTGRIDSSGIFRSWYGRWFDRDQGKIYQDHLYTKQEEVPALCGALMFCRHQALKSVLLAPCQVMDPSFYMYKEDIDLSLRMKQKGWMLIFDPSLVAYHCRGWQQDRSKVARRFRLLSAQNEMRLYKRLKSPCYFYSACKYWLVKIFDL